MLHDGTHQDLAVLAHAVHIDLPAALHELGDHHGVLAGDLGGLVQVAAQLLRGVGHVHRRAREDIRGADQQRVAFLLAEGQRVCRAAQLAPRRLRDPRIVAELRELVPVLRLVDLQRGSAEHVHARAHERQRDGVGNLPADGDEHAVAALRLVHVQHAFEGELVEVETVALVVVRAHRLGVVVEHHARLAQLAQRADGRHGAPVELHTAADTVHTTAKHECALLIECNVVLVSVVGHVQVVGRGGRLRAGRVDLLDDGPNAMAQARGTHVHLTRRHAVTNETGDLLVGEARLFGDEHGGRRQLVQGDAGQHTPHVRDALLLPQEPWVDLRQRVDAVHRPAPVECGCHREDARVRRHLKCVGQLRVRGDAVVAEADLGRLEAEAGGVDHAQRLLQRLLPRATDGHHLAHRLHGRADFARDFLELVEVPARHLGDDVVEGGLEAGRCRLGHRVGQLGQQHAQRELGGHGGERVARGLGGEGGRAGQARVHLDDAVVGRVGVERVLDVALAHDAQVAHHVDGGGAQHVVLRVRERLRGCDYDGVSRVHAERVEVFHVAHGDAVVGRVAHHLVLHLLPPLE
mmetsp:Transcript_33629/g.83769  ORF Transcript_33629/g.83769 Transcript_33629/m.83769 type:complete len:577 (-) Transcript_33629:2098-3828(-)